MARVHARSSRISRGATLYASALGRKHEFFKHTSPRILVSFSVVQGELDYKKLAGDTGPLVYPAGFVYIFSWLRSVTQEQVFPAQIFFAVLYIATQLVVFKLYIDAASLPPWTLLLLCISRRMHSIFVLRLFNDCWAMFFAYLATVALQQKRWALAVFIYSLAVSVKMNALLFAPGVLAVLLKV